MPHLLGLEVHSAGLTVAAMRPDQTIVLRPVDDLASVLRRTNARRWKWSLGVAESEADATEAANELFLALQHALGDAPTLVGVAVKRSSASETATPAARVIVGGTAWSSPARQMMER